MARKARSKTSTRASSTRTKRTSSTAKRSVKKSDSSYHSQHEMVLIFSFFVSIFVFSAILVYLFSVCKSAYYYNTYEMQMPLIEKIQELEKRVETLEMR